MFLDRIRRLVARPYPGRIELAALAVLYGGYEIVRGFGTENWVAARAHTADIVGLEQRLNIFVELDVQNLAAALPVVPALLGFLYVALHFGGTAVALTWVHRRHPHAFPFLRTTLIVSTALALVGYVMYPAAPPRLADLGFADTVSTHTGLNLSSDLLGSLYNPIAAVPSLHFGYSLIVGVAIAQLASRRWIRIAGAAYPALMLVVIVAHRQPLPLRRVRRRGRRRRRLVRRRPPRGAGRRARPGGARAAPPRHPFEHLDPASHDPRTRSLTLTLRYDERTPTAHVSAEAQQQHRGPDGSLERRPLEDRGLRLARARRRVRLRRRRGRHEVPRGHRSRRRRGRQGRPARRGRLPRGEGRAGRDRPDPVQDADRRRSRLQGDDRGRREDPRGEPEGPQARHAARRRSRRPRLGRRPRGAGAVPARRHLRRGRRSTSTRSTTRSTRPRPRTTTSPSASSAASPRPRRPTRHSRACSRRPR